jgi:hypothetical protein
MRADRRAGMTKLIVAFSQFAHAPYNRTTGPRKEDKRGVNG